MTETQRALVKGEVRRHIALAQACTEPPVKELHLAVAEALEAAIMERDDAEVCRSEINLVSCRRASAARKQKRRTPGGRKRRER